MSKLLGSRRSSFIALGVAGFLLVILVQLAMSIRTESATWDEDDHIFAGYMSLKTADFGLNPEHPPLVKMLATLPLLHQHLYVPKIQNRSFKMEAYADGNDFLFHNNIGHLLFQVRMAAASLTLLLALLVFLASQEMFGTEAGFIALTLVAFEPNLLAHGALVTTDMGISCFMFATVYAFYRYVKAPSYARLVLVGLAAGLALASKHTGILLLPMLILLAISEILRPESEAEDTRPERAVKMTAALGVITVIAVTVLWGFYGFRYQARPGNLQLNPTMDAYIQQLDARDAHIVGFLAHFHLLPESYLFGLADVRMVADYMPSYIFGKVYAHGVWYYFPAAFVIKATLAFLILLVLTMVAIAMRRFTRWREILFLSIPPVFHLLIAMSAGLNIGARHILPLFVFFSVLIAGAMWTLIQHNRRWVYVVGALLLFHVISSLRAYPVYLAYANEAWGGQANTYKYLTDSNVDWGQQLIAVRGYLQQHNIQNCWFAYFAQGALDARSYGIPCKPLPTADTLWFNEELDVPPVIDGPVLISVGTLTGYEFGSSQLNPYQQFVGLRPKDTIQYGVFVYDGHFAVPMAAALTHAQKSSNLLGEKKTSEALAEAQTAVTMDAECIQAETALGDALVALNQPQQAHAAYEKALLQINKLEPDEAKNWLPGIERKLAGS
ncbi:MAG: ArnT family glycosyltransferase [Acidobacteriaceae bacterium]